MYDVYFLLMKVNYFRLDQNFTNISGQTEGDVSIFLFSRLSLNRRPLSLSVCPHFLCQSANWL